MDGFLSGYLGVGKVKCSSSLWVSLKRRCLLNAKLHVMRFYGHTAYCTMNKHMLLSKIAALST